MIKIIRSFSLKRQAKQFEPVDWYCGVEMEVDPKDLKKMSKKLAEFCQKEVEEAEYNYFTPPKVVEKFDEDAPAKIDVKPWDYKKDFGKMYGPGIKNKDIAETERQAAELSTEEELGD